jgi:uncharacterized LabA/DUF88 family protein
LDTIVYIDGYNLYYGRLKSNGFKWIDVYHLVETICKVQDPTSNIIKVKYFTAPVRTKFSSHGQEANKSQDSYHKALKEIRGESIEIIKGFHTVEKGNAAKYNNPIDLIDRVDIWDFEEKQTDVNIAMHMYRDAFNDNCTQQVLVSNDSDLESALKFIKEDKPKIVLGLIIPKANNIQGRPVTKYLDKYSDWTRKYILDDECEKSLMPDKVPTKKKCIFKPSYW